MPNEDQPGGPPWTVMSVLQWTANYFKRQGLDHPRGDADILLAYALGCQRIDLYLRHDQPLNEAELNLFKQLVKRRVQREPVAYIIGVKEFWSLALTVTPDVLIPRPDTECLVERSLDLLPAGQSAPARRVLELGVGSGAITVALAHERPSHFYWASDASWPAIQVACTNARRHGVQDRIRFFAGHWFAPIAQSGAGFDLILSNPPYVRREDIAQLAPEITLYEPLAALDGGPDGLAAIAIIIAAAADYLRPEGLLLLEIGYDQRDAVAALARQVGAYHPIVFHKDYAGHHRVAQMQKRQAD